MVVYRIRNVISFLLFTCSSICNGYSQKPSIDLDACRNWPDIGSPVMSNDGNYFLYTINKSPIGTTLVIQGIKDDWKKEVMGASSNNAVFSERSDQLIYLKSGDTLVVLNLATKHMEFIADVNSFKLPKLSFKEWLAYKRKSQPKTLILRNLISGLMEAYESILDYEFSDNGKVLLLKKEIKSDSSSFESLQWINLPDRTKVNIWKGKKLGQFSFDASCTKFAFISQQNNGNFIWFFQTGIDSAKLIIRGDTSGIEDGLDIFNGRIVFSKDGHRIFFKLRRKYPLRPKPESVKIDIWSYTDAKLKSQLLEEIKRNPSRISNGVANLETGKIIQIENDNEEIIPMPDNGVNDTIMLTRSRNMDETEWYWNRENRSNIYLLSTVNGSKKNISNKEGLGFVLSPGGKYVIFYVPNEKNYFTYEISSGITRNITKGIAANWTNKREQPNDIESPIYRFKWLQADSGLLICEENDIWQVSPSSIFRPINLTNHYGSKNNIEFRLAIAGEKKLFKNGERILLEAFNKSTKENGFYETIIGIQRSPLKLSMGPYVYRRRDFENFPEILESEKENIYIVRRMSATDAPNYYLTNDFREFRRISQLEPQKEFNWFTSHLISWETFNGTKSHGVIYKPENFDPLKRYPIIFYIYEKLSDHLNEYEVPAVNGAIINIPFYVSNGYLVFEPDIHYKIGDPGQSIYNSVVSAARYLRTLPWVDFTKMGVQGHSFGGYEVNYLITRTNIFVAAASGSGISDLVSLYNGTSYGGKSEQFQVENAQQRLGRTLWENPNLYIRNSPLFDADKIVTPILLMANKGDNNVPFSQSLEFFTALRRLGKRVWMLQYDDEQHILVERKNAEDYTIRLKQFFDHFLKGQPAPKWMTKGIPATNKGIDDGLELDTSHKISGSSLLIVPSRKCYQIERGY